MNVIFRKTISVLLTLVLAVNLAIPVLAAPAEGIALDETSITLAPGAKRTLNAVISPEDADEKTVTWASLKPEVAAVSNKGVVTAVAVGTTTITATLEDTGHMAICSVTVAEDWATNVLLAPAGPERLPVGTSRQLAAAVTYALGSGTQGVTWSSTNPAVAVVSDDGLVTAVAEGTASIVAQSKALSKEGTPLSAIYEVTVTPAEPDSALDFFTLTTGDPNLLAGLYQTLTLPVPEVQIVNGTNDVTHLYTISYLWTDGSGQTLSTTANASVTPVILQDMEVSCLVTATRTNDSTKVFSSTAVYTIKVQSGTILGAVLETTAGPVSFGELADMTGLTLMEQLTQGGEDSVMTPALPGLTHLVFDPASTTGLSAGSLEVEDGVWYTLTREQEPPAEEEPGEDAADPDETPTAPLADVKFTPLAAGTYSIHFTAYGEETWQGQLEIVVSEPLPPVQAEKSCDSAGFNFTGSDFFRADDPDPVASVIFGVPTAGKLLLDFGKGGGTLDRGFRYYTDSALDGEYHVSTLSYLPSEGYAGQAIIPMTLVTRSGVTRAEELVVEVESKVSSEQFTDVVPETVGTWAANAVDFAYGRHLVSGVEDTLFAPNALMTRAQLVTVLYRAAGSPDAAVTTSFTDLEEGSYYYDAVVWANFHGIVNGTEPGTFSPNAPVTRQQLAAILHRYAQAMGADNHVEGSLDGFADKGLVEPYAVAPMTWAVNRGIITGTTETTLSPLDQATRAQVVVMLHRYLVG